MPTEISALLELVLRLLQQFAAWLEVAPREPSGLRHLADLAIPGATAAAAALIGLSLGNSHQSRMRERDEIGEAWDGPLARLRSVVASARWPALRHDRRGWQEYAERGPRFREAEEIIFAEVIPHRLSRFIGSEIRIVHTWVTAERERRSHWYEVTEGTSDRLRAVLAFLLLNPDESLAAFTEAEATRSLLAVGVEAAPEAVTRTMQYANEPGVWPRLRADATEQVRLAHDAWLLWVTTDMALAVASARGGPIRRQSLASKWAHIRLRLGWLRPQ